MNEKKLRVAKPVLVAATLATILWVSAGSLTPPAGPIASTMKDLATVEPRIPISATTTPGDATTLFRITQPGSYYLTGNITGVSGKSGIEIAASGVTLDLMGFDLLGVAGSLDGIRVTVAVTDIAVVDGSVRNWSADGVDLSGANNSRLGDLRVSANAGDGINAGTNGVVTKCAAYSNGGSGIRNLFGSITDCSARNNSGPGIYSADSCTITNCSATSNTFAGIAAAGGSTITNCKAKSNGGNGIQGGFSSTIINCVTEQNENNGIFAISDCTIRGNTCYSNRLSAGGGNGAGIHATGLANRIEGNNCTNNARGIALDATGNFITRNTCRGNTTNWDIAAGNVCLVVSATAGAAILGNSGGVAPGSTDPNANFTY